MTGTYVLSAGYYDAYYLKAQRVRQLINADFIRAFQSVDVLIGPTTPTPAFAIGAKTADPITMYLNDIYTIGANLAGLPAVSMPCGFVEGPAGRTADRRPALQRGARAAAPRTPSSARPTGTRACRGATHERAGKPSSGWRSTPSSPRSRRSSPARRRATARRRTAQANLVDLGYPGVLPVLNGEAVRMAVKLGLALECAHRVPLGVRAQELLLPGPAEGLPDQPVRAADRRRGRHRHRARGRQHEAHRRHPRPPGGGRRQVAARRAAGGDRAST